MRKVLLVLVGLFLFTSCTKEELTEEISEASCDCGTVIAWDKYYDGYMTHRYLVIEPDCDERERVRLYVKSSIEFQFTSLGDYYCKNLKQ